MKKLWQYILVGAAAAIGGLFVSDITGEIFNGMDYGSACVLGICMYLCVVIVTCTGIIVTKLDKNKNSEETCDKQGDI
ncbi:MAG: hypothetical protein K2K54_07860 [Lachnospiraceae bacterium]|nr:hypothetical protein [Lachnospiraceae bacterium]